MNDASVRSLPPVVAWLGYAGLLPFVVLALAIRLDPHGAPYWSKALIAYGAVILSFVGALHWGFAMTLPELDPDRRLAWFAWSTVPALIAWPAMLLATATATALLVAGFVAHYWQDWRLAAALPAWYLPLRARLSGVAVVCLLGGGWLATP